MTLFDKNAGVEEFKRTVRFAAGCLASLYGLAGFDDLAAKIRPRRRASRQAGGGGPEGGVDQTAGSEESDSPESESVEPPAEGEDAADPARGEASGPIGIVR